VTARETSLLTWGPVACQSQLGLIMEQSMTFTLAVQDMDHHIIISVSDSQCRPRISLVMVP